MTAPATMQNEVMKWGRPQPRSGEGESGAHDRAGDDAERSDEVGAPPAAKRRGGERRT